MRRAFAVSACAAIAIAASTLLPVTSAGAATAPYPVTFESRYSNQSQLPRGTGLTQAIGVRASGFQAGQLVFVEQCDGTSPSAQGWDPTIDCDLGSSPSPRAADSNGNVYFDPTDPNFAFRMTSGPSPQGLFNCLGPTEASPANGLPDFANCQIRVSSSNQTTTTDQVFFTNVVMPDPTTGIACNVSVNILTPPTKPFNAVASKANLHVKGIGGTFGATGTTINPPVAPPPFDCVGPKVATLNPKKGAVTSATIKFGLTTVYAQNTACNAFDTGDFNGWTATKVQVKLLNGLGKPVGVYPTTVVFSAVNPVADFAGGEGFALVLQRVKSGVVTDTLRLVLHSALSLGQMKAACLSPGGLGTIPFTGSVELL